MRTQRFSLRTGRGYTIAGTFFPGGKKAFQKPVIILCHGIGVTSEYPLMRSLRRQFLTVGYAVVQFDFAGHGKSGGGIRHRLVRYFIRDVKDVVEWILKKYPVTSLVIVGHSIGALATLLYAADNPRKLSGIALIGCNAQAAKKYNDLVSRGVLQTTKKYFILGTSRLPKNFWNDRAKYEPRRFVGKIAVPVAYLCGTRDTTNPISESRLLYRWTRAPRKLIAIPRADHRCRQPRDTRAIFAALRRWITTL